MTQLASVARITVTLIRTIILLYYSIGGGPHRALYSKQCMYIILSIGEPVYC